MIGVDLLVDQLLTALKLEQHLKVSALSDELARSLIASLDDYIEQDAEDPPSETNESDEPPAPPPGLKSCLELICQRLRKLARFTRIYNDIVEFVHIQDLVCLSHLVGALKLDCDTPDHPTGRLDIDLLAKTLRQCKLLLREINFSASNNKSARLTSDNKHCCWLDRGRDIIRVDSIGFPKYVIDFEPLVKRQQAGQPIPEVDQLVSQLDEQSIPLVAKLKSDSFSRLIEKTLRKNRLYPFNRFTILVALLIVGYECDHKTLIQLTYELIDQVYHQEANSCHLDELMQLREVGSIWLSHKKRFQVTLRRFQHQDGIQDNDDDDDDDNGIQDDDNNDSSSSISEASTSPRNIEGEREDHLIKNNNADSQTTGKVQVDFRHELRKLIDNELLLGTECLLCGRPPGGALLEPIHLSHCPSCGLDLINMPFCSLTCEPIELVPLDSVSRILPNLKQIIVVKPNEWAQHFMTVASQWLGVNLSTSQNPGKANNNKRPAAIDGDEDSTERIDISENFERLVVLRRNNTSRREGSSNTDDDDDDEDAISATNDSNSENSSTDENSLDDTDKGLNSTIETHTKTELQTYFKTGYLKSLNNQPNDTANLCESLKLARYLRNKSKSGQNQQQHQVERLILNSGDIMVCDSSSDQSRIGLKIMARSAPVKSSRGAESRRNGGSLLSHNHHRLIVCQTNDYPINGSQLQIGCGRLYNPFELVRSTGQRLASGNAVCPQCSNDNFQGPLTELVRGFW